MRYAESETTTVASSNPNISAKTDLGSAIKNHTWFDKRFLVYFWRIQVVVWKKECRLVLYKKFNLTFQSNTQWILDIRNRQESIQLYKEVYIPKFISLHKKWNKQLQIFFTKYQFVNKCLFNKLNYNSFMINIKWIVSKWKKS